MGGVVGGVGVKEWPRCCSGEQECEDMVSFSFSLCRMTGSVGRWAR